MTHTVTTLCNNKIILATIGKILTLQDCFDVNIEIMELVQATTDDVHVVIDMSVTKKHPLNALKIKEAVIWEEEPNIKTICHISTNFVTLSIAKVVISWVVHKYKAFSTLRAAYQRIVKVDDSILSIDEILVEHKVVEG